MSFEARFDTSGVARSDLKAQELMFPRPAHLASICI